MISLDAAEAAARRSATIGSAMALAGAVSYGVNIVFARLCAQLGITGADIIVYRSMVLLPLLGAFFIVTGANLRVPAGQKPVLIRFAASAAVTAIFYLTSLQYLPVPMAVTVFYTYPLIVMLLTPIVDRLPLPGRRWIAGAVAFAGVVLAVGPAHAALDWRGVVFAALGSLSCAAMFINGARLDLDSRATFFWCQAVAAPAALAFAFVSGGLSRPDAIIVAAIPFAMTALCYFLGFLLQILAAPRITAATAGLLFLLEPVSAIAGAVLLLGETLAPLQAAGMALVLTALIADLWPNVRRPAPIETP